MSCTFEDAFMVNPLDESLDDAHDSDNRPQEFSSEEQNLKISAPTNEVSVVNDAQVMMIKAEIASGTYQIDSGVIANKLIEELGVSPVIS